MFSTKHTFFALRVYSQWPPLCINLKNLKSTLLDANHGAPLEADVCKDYILMLSSPRKPYPLYIIPFPICTPRSSLFAHSYHHLNNLTSSRKKILPTHIFLQSPHYHSLWLPSPSYVFNNNLERILNPTFFLSSVNSHSPSHPLTLSRSTSL